MDFSDSASEADYRRAVSVWLDGQAQAFSGLDFAAMSEQEELPYSRQWQAIKAAAGYAAIPLASELGGGGGIPMEGVIFGQEEKRRNFPSQGYFDIGLGMAMPTMMSFARQDQNAELVPRLLSGENIWCQLFSEPSAGSDLANVRTRAVKEGEDWVINGQKVWTTQGHLADYGILLTRSDPDQPKHTGMTFFFVDMRSEGIEVRPIRQINGECEFNEVYLTDVRIPDSQRLGDVGSGFKVALTTLMFERQAGSELSLGLLDADDVMDFFQTLVLDGKPAVENASVRAALADWYLCKSGLRYVLYRRLTQMSAGRMPGPEAAMGKLVEARATQDITRFCMQMLGPAGAVAAAEAPPELAKQIRAALYSPGIRIAGGTDEILKNTLAERVLGMPREPQPDRNIPFKQLNS